MTYVESLNEPLRHSTAMIEAVELPTRQNAGERERRKRFYEENLGTPKAWTKP